MDTPAPAGADRPACSREFRLALRDLGAFCWQTGDLARGDGGGADAREGIAGHRQVRARRPPGYRQEVAVRLAHAGNGWQLQAGGRIDGLYEEDGLWVVEEIKTLHGDPARLPATVRELHRVQARLYAALLAQRESLPRIGVEVTWFDLDSGREHRERTVMAAGELAAFLAATLARIAPWLDALCAHRDARDRALAALPFPHAGYRPGQRALVAATYRALRDRQPLLAEAPTGIGKTVSTLYPALKGFPAGLHERLAWLTATYEGRRMPEQVLADLAARCRDVTPTPAGVAPLLTVSLSARERHCLCSEGQLDGAPCPFATGFHERLPAARMAALAGGVLDRAALHELGERFRVCPWALGRALAPWADVLVLDLNQAFDPGARLGFLLDDAPARTSLLIDEAHHLAPRVRAMHSETLDLDALRALATARRGTPLAKAARALARQGTRLQQRGGNGTLVEEHHALDVDDALATALDAFIEAAGAVAAPDLLQEGNPRTADPALADLFFRASHARALIEQWNERFALLVPARGTPGYLRMACLDAAPLLAPVWPAVRGVALFSGTLSPLAETRARAGLPMESTLLSLPSPFPPGHLGVFLCNHVDTRLAARPASLDEVARLAVTLVSARPGRYLLAFPSYRYLQDALQAMRGQLPADCHVVAQTTGMDTTARDAFLASFRDHRTPWVAGFGIAGGLFAEGVDFPGEQLIGVMVVGTALPAISAEREVMRRRFDAVGEDGWMHAYQLPGMTRVLQTAGRLIRSEDDRGVLVLVDRRYGHADIRALLPPGWQPRRASGAPALADALAAFWRGDSAALACHTDKP